MSSIDTNTTGVVKQYVLIKKGEVYDPVPQQSPWSHDICAVIDFCSRFVRHVSHRKTPHKEETTVRSVMWGIAKP